MGKKNLKISVSLEIPKGMVSEVLDEIHHRSSVRELEAVADLGGQAAAVALAQAHADMAQAGAQALGGIVPRGDCQPTPPAPKPASSPASAAGRPPASPGTTHPGNI